MVKHAVLLIVFPVLVACGTIVRGVSDGVDAINASQSFRQGRFGALTEEELAWASTAGNTLKITLSFKLD